MTKILIVEDNEMNRDMLSRRLSRKGYDIEIAVDGAEGLVMMRNNTPDLVLMDMGLPVMDGWEATTQARLTQPSPAFQSSPSRHTRWKKINRKHWALAPMTSTLSPLTCNDCSTKSNKIWRLSARETSRRAA